MVLQFNHVAINVKDIRKTVDFYSKYLGAHFVRGLYMPGGHMVGVYMQIGSFMIEFLSPLDPNPDATTGLDHIAFIVDDIHKEYKHLTKKGFDFLVPPKTAGSGGSLLAFFKDPNGVKVELIERADTFMEEWEPSCGVLGMDHASCYVNDLEASRRFYLDELGFKTLHDYNFPERHFGMLYLNFGQNVMEYLHDNTTHEGTMLPHIALRVKDCKEMAQTLEKEGVSIMTAPKELATKNGFFCNILDPDGVQIELIDRASLFDVEE